MTFEIKIIKFLQNISNHYLDILAEAITMLGEQYVIIIILAFIYFVHNKKEGEYIAYSLFTSLALNNTLKGVFQRKRPFQIDNSIIGKRASTATGFSFPSGHTQTSAVFYTSLSEILNSKKFKIISLVIILLVAISRMYLGVHYLSDIVMAILLGMSCSYLGLFLYKRFKDNDTKKLLLFIITAAVFFPFIFIFYQYDFESITPFRDFYTGYSLFLGFIGAVYIENKYVNFDCSNPLKIRIIRYLIALVFFIVTMFGLKLILPENNIFIDMLRYFLVTFITMGIYPLIFKKQLFS